MESVNNAMDINLLLNVLAHGKEQTRMLETSLISGSTSAEHCSQIQATFGNAILIAECMLKSIGSAGNPVFHNRTTTASDSPGSNSGSPQNEDSERVFKEHERREMCKKRKTMPKWAVQLNLSPTGGGDAVEDGFSWRKYGQKDILGAKHPRGYYRCTHRNTIGCLATKQVQKCDDNPSIVDITYRGEHTCQQKSKQTNDQQIMKQNAKPAMNQQQLLHNFQTGLKVKTEALDNKLELQEQQTFSFTSTPISSFGKPENNIFSTSSTPENFMGSNFSPSFISPATTTESNYFSLSGCGMNNYVGTAGVNTCESELTEIISAPTTSELDIGNNYLDLAEHFKICYGYDATNDFGSMN